MALLERDWVLETLHNLATEAADGHGGMVFIAGEAGAGKTSVIRSFLDQQPDSRSALIGACDSISTPGQLWPLHDLARRASPALRHQILAGADREELFRGVLAELSARPGATIMVVEDIHWADDATLDLLRFLGRRIATTRGLVIVTYRDESAAQMQRLRLMLGDLATAPGVHRLQLPPLTRAAVAELAYGRSIDLDELYARTSGNAFYVAEMLAAGNRLPTTVSDAVLARYARIPARSRHIIDLAAVIGLSVDMRVLMAVAGGSQDDLNDSIESGALRFDGHTVHFRHQLTRDAVLTGLSPIRRAQLYGVVFDAFESQGHTADPATMAHFAEEAGRPAAVPAYAKAAGERALRLRSYREAAAQFQRALQYSEDRCVSERSDLLGKLASATFYCGSGETDIDILRQLVAYYRTGGNVSQVVSHLVWLTWVLDDEGLRSESLATIAEADRIALEVDDPALRCETLATYSYLLAHEERWAEALECNAAAFALAEESGNAHTMFRCRLYRGFTLLNSDERTGAALISDCIEIGRQHGYDAEVAHAMSSLGFHWTDTNQLDRADRALAGAAEFAVAHELDCWQRWTRLGMSRSALARGDWQHAADLAGSVIQVRNGCFSNRFYGYLTIARIRARRGDPEVELALEAAAASCPEEPTPWLAAQLAAARTEATFLAGDHDRALQIARQALPSAARYGYRWIAGELGHYLIAAGGTLPCKIETSEPYRAELTGDWVTACREWESLGTPYEAARALARIDDEASLRDALDRFERLGAEPMYTLVIGRLRALGVSAIPRGRRSSTKMHPFGLTAREAEVLAQLEQGWTNGEIAARLFLSDRTVEHHVSAVLAKLGVKSRRDAVRLARERSLAGIEQTHLLAS